MLTIDEIGAARARIGDVVRPLTVAPFAPRVSLALEFLQFSGSFKARGAANFVLAHAERGTLPDSGIAIASGGNAGLAFVWAARLANTKATVFVPATTPDAKLDRLTTLGAIVHRVGTEYGEAAEACANFGRDNDVLLAHAYADPLMAAGAGTLVDEIVAHQPGVDTVVVSVGGGGLFAGVATAAAAHGIRTVGVEPRTCRALNAAIEAGRPVDVEVDSIAMDSLGARRATDLALQAAQASDTRSILVDDREIADARDLLWDEHRIGVEYGAAAALAAIRGPYVPGSGERACVVLCGANIRK
ncbi:pyridoxal-phosphate dependent enzyme [Amycolatopsis jejuensis]|uniref:pyridoxal-phosphate dependent enzyme n=1 Tax=Amycolatopsis jejuensis TaxID=330084 RepID=UPI0005259F4A|nr:pyridoxal-phosphate dependent enzyme [Amycolatopsis jejuensis]